MKEQIKFKILTHEIDYEERFGKGYPRIEPGSMFYMWYDPWNNIHNIIRKMTIIHNLFRFISCDHPISVLDCGAGFAENQIYLDRFRKPKGMRINYKAIDVDPDKKEIALMINPNLNYETYDIYDMNSIEEFDVIICNDFLKYTSPGKEIRIIRNIYKAAKDGGIIVFSIRTSYLSNKGRQDEDGLLLERSSQDLFRLLNPLGFFVLDEFHFGLYENDLKFNSDRIPSKIGCYPLSLLQNTDDGIRFILYIQKKV